MKLLFTIISFILKLFGIVDLAEKAYDRESDKSAGMNAQRVADDTASQRYQKELIESAQAAPKSLKEIDSMLDKGEL